jgi:hypothetical protein
MNEIQLRDLLFKMFPPEPSADWDDVLRRAKRPSSSARRLTLLVAAAVLVVLAVGSALALSGRLGGLFHGTPVNDLTPSERFLLSEFDMKGRVELIAKRNASAFYVIRRSDGRLCYSIGNVRKNVTPFQRESRSRFGGASCIDGRVFPSRAMPVLNFSYYSYRTGDLESRLVGLQGFAADAVDRVGVIGRDKRIVFSVPVVDNVYTAGRKGISGARGIVALDKDGKVLWVQCQAMERSPAPQFPSGGCGKYKNSPPPNVTPTPRPAKPVGPPGPVVVQRGEADGVRILVRGAQIEANFGGISAETRRLLKTRQGRINVGCFKLITIGNSHYSSGSFVTTPFTTVVRVRPWSPDGARRAPFVGCTATGTYGHSWNDAHGTHDAVEVPLTARGRRFFADRAVARDIAWLARARVFHDIRYMRETLSAQEVARRLGSRVVVLDSSGATPPVGKLGVWTGEQRRIVLVERSSTGRRLFLDIRRGIIYRTNFLGLTQIL